MSEKVQPAVLWKGLENQQVQCQLCNFRCRIAAGELGRCQVRRNIEGKLYSLNYHAVCSAQVDPIEKKPLFHFQPGQRSFSIAAVGCNFQCDFCQNWQISQSPRLQKELRGGSVTPEEVVSQAKAYQCGSIAYTYTEPTVFMELCADCGRLARQENLANVFVSNGYMTIEALEYARDFLDAINVDLKAFTEDFYHQRCQASLKPVRESLRHIARQTDIWLEVTTLVIPGLNDSAEELKQIAEFIAGELGEQVPWHVSRFYPNFELTDTPATPVETLARAYELGKQAGLHYIYVGNMPGFGHESTYCHKCGELLIERTGYHIGRFNLIDGACPGCGEKMAGKNLVPIKF